MFTRIMSALRRRKPPVVFTGDREPITFISVVNDFEEAKHNLLDSPVRSSTRHEWIIVDNVDNKAGQNMSRIYHDAARQAKNDLVYFLHQDVWLPEVWEDEMYISLAKVEKIDPQWGVIGAAGVVSFDIAGPPMRGHWADAWGKSFIKRIGPPPCEVQSLDELWLGYRKSRGLEFDPDMPGWHCYGIDLCLNARSHGFRNYAVDALAWHKYRNNKGERILRSKDSVKIVARSTPAFALSKTYVHNKWKHFLPFRSTSTEWHP